MNNVLTASRMSALLRCPRAHYWSYECGLRKDTAGVALRLGSAWARALECMYKGGDGAKALEAALPEGIDLDETSCSVVAGLLAAYIEKWAGDSRLSFAAFQPEKQFRQSLGPKWTAEGKLDLLAVHIRGVTIVESKTTASSIDPSSDFWLRLRFNTQVLQYVCAAEKMGFNVNTVIYDVTRKPSIRPKMITDLDEDGLKIVKDAVLGERSKTKKGWRQTGGKGFVVQEHRETPEEFSNRLADDCRERPDFYFARREVPILRDDVSSFKRHRSECLSLIEHYRSRQLGYQANAWPRNVSEMNCRCCQFKDFCLTGTTVDLKSPPVGFSIQPFNPELEKEIDDAAPEEI